MVIVNIDDKFEDISRIEFSIHKMVKKDGCDTVLYRLIKLLNRPSLYGFLYLFNDTDYLTRSELMFITNYSYGYICRMIKDLIDIGFLTAINTHTWRLT
jgi:hypothetical protein